MRSTMYILFVLAVASPGFADDLGKSMKYEVKNLPKSITAKTADVIAVVLGIKSDDIKSIKTTSSNPDIKVRAVDVDGEVRIIITGDKKGDAKVGWGYVTKGGKDGGYIDLEIKIE